MPSFRRDRPERPEHGPRPGPRPFRREPAEDEPQEQEGGFSFRRSQPPFRREQGPSEYVSRPVSPSERKELWEVMVPGAEQEDPEFDYGVLLDMLPHWSRRGKPASGPGPVPPRGAPPGQDPRFSQRRDERPEIDASQIFELNRIWSAAEQLRRHKDYRVGGPIALVRMAPMQEMHRYLQVQPSQVQMVLDELAYAINYVKPREFQGKFFFHKAKDGFEWLFYVE